jgi:ABC-type tungstate transport system substrate-binding protein
MFAIAGIIAFIFLIAKFIEMRFIEKENKPLKIMIRDALLVYCCVLVGLVLYEQVSPANLEIKSPNVFTDNPEF